MDSKYIIIHTVLQGGPTSTRPGPCAPKNRCISNLTSLVSIARHHRLRSSYKLSPQPKMSCCRIFLQRAPHAPIPPLSALARCSLRLRPLAPKPRLIRGFSATRLRLSKLPPSHRPASKDLYPLPDKSKRYRMCFGPRPRSAAEPDAATVFPETLVIYHAGTGRVLYLAVLKLTTIVLSAIFCGVLVPAYITDEKPWWECAGRESPPLSPHTCPHEPPSPETLAPTKLTAT